ncbi:Replication protein A subunit [Mycena kentingensis (nom. inval.)]|nr:Replication protein A subunit [Mycena kentingensis (nom. inval.)]
MSRAVIVVTLRVSSPDHHLLDAMVSLSAGSCQALQTSEPTDTSVFDATHTLQVLSVKPVNTAQSTNADRYRIIVSDGVNFVQAMLATQLNSLVNDGDVQKHSIICVTKFTCNFVQDKRLLIILALHLVEHCENKIGNPASVGATEASASAATTPAPAPAARAPPQQQQPQQQQQRTTPAASNSNHGSIYPIEGLSPYQNNWTIKARVTQKSELKKYSNQRGDGSLFNVTLMDDTGEIRATAFNAVANDLFERLQEDKVYYISRARVNFAKKQFSHLSNEYELGFEKNTLIEECLDITNVPQVKYNFIPLDQLESIPKDSTCDVIAVVSDMTATSTITSKASREIVKRELTLVDKSKFQVRMTLWGKQAENFSSVGSVIAFKNVKVGDFGGRSLSFFSSSGMSIDPMDNSEANLLRGWYDGPGKEESFQQYQSTGGGGGGGPGFQADKAVSIADMKQKATEQTSGDNTNANNVYFSTRATLLFIKPENMWYPACQGKECNKKVVENGTAWSCESCGSSWPRPEYRYIMSLAVADHSDQAWLQGFNEVGLAIFGQSADALHAMKEDDENTFNAFVLEKTCEKYNFLLRAKNDEYNGNQRVRYGISRMTKVDFKEEMRNMRQHLLGPWGQTAI